MGICQRVCHTPHDVHGAQLFGSGLILLGDIVSGQQELMDCNEDGEGSGWSTNLIRSRLKELGELSLE